MRNRTSSTRVADLRDFSTTRLAILSLLTLLTTSMLAGCRDSATSPLQVSGFPLATFSVAVNQELDITLQSIGPGDYIAPPTLTGSAISFLDVTPGIVNVPAGATQIFRFKGVAAGNTIIQFHSTAGRDATDTVVVR